MEITKRMRRLRRWNLFKRNIPFARYVSITSEGEAAILHLRNMYQGSHAYSEIARKAVDDVMANYGLTEKEAIEFLFRTFYVFGVIDEDQLNMLDS